MFKVRMETHYQIRQPASRRLFVKAAKTWSALILSLLTLTACTVSPTGRQQALLFDDQQLAAMGQQAMVQYLAEKPTVASGRVNRYVECVAQAITATVPAGTSDWRVVVFKDSTPNAFALPGGLIGVHTGLLDVTDNQDQLAAVIGHEVGHVLARHANERLSQQMLASTGLQLLGSAVGSQYGASAAADLQRFGPLLTQTAILLPYSRSHETEADQIGLDLMARAGFDPREAPRLWQNMNRAGSAQTATFLSTHPSNTDRQAALSAQLPQVISVYQQALARGVRPRCG